MELLNKIYYLKSFHLPLLIFDKFDSDSLLSQCFVSIQDVLFIHERLNLLDKKKSNLNCLMQSNPAVASFSLYKVQNVGQYSVRPSFEQWWSFETCSHKISDKSPGNWRRYGSLNMSKINSKQRNFWRK